MSFIQNLFTSRDNNANSATYVGQQDRIWWDPVTNAFYGSNGNTAGGVPVGVNGSNVVLDNFTANSGTVTGNLVIVGNISPASANKIGGIIPGPGVNVGNTGILTIDSANLPVSFGNFYANNNILTIVNMDQNMILETQGNAEVQLIGNIGFYQTDGGTPTGQYFKATVDGQISMYVPATDTNLGAVEIIGSTTGCVVAPGQGGAMLHITGQKDQQSRVYVDGNGSYVAFVGRAWNGNLLTGIQAIQAGNDVMRLNATAATAGNVGNVAFAQIRFTAIENQTLTNQGSNINFWTTAAGANANSRMEVANISVANGVSATKFTAGGTITATGNVTGGNVLTGGLISSTGNITGGNLSGTNIVGTLTTAAQTNITAVGTLTTLSVSGNVTGGNILTSGLISSTGNATHGNILTSGLISSTGNITGGNLNVSTGGTIRTPKVIINDGGIRTVAGGTALTLDFSTDSIVLWTSPSGTATITLSNYTPGVTAKVIIRVGTTSRDINYGVVDGNNSTTGSNNFNGSGAGSTSIANQAFILDYTCYDATAANCYVQVNWQ
jgi:hypothetical protein